MMNDPARTDMQRRFKRTERIQARWKDPETQRIEAERRKMEADRERGGRIDGFNKEIDRLRAELDKENKARIVKEGQLRDLVAKLAEMTGPEIPVFEAKNEEAVPEPEPAEEAPRGRGRPAKAAAR